MVDRKGTNRRELMGLSAVVAAWLASSTKALAQDPGIPYDPSNYAVDLFIGNLLGNPNFADAMSDPDREDDRVPLLEAAGIWALLAEPGPVIQDGMTQRQIDTLAAIDAMAWGDLITLTNAVAGSPASEEGLR
jgi:hypothetical protein